MKKYFQTAIFIVAIILPMQSISSQANEQDDFRLVLASAKMAGACGILDQMVDFQSKTKMNGGDEFVVRFWNTEAARLGMTVEEFSEQCNQSINFYDNLWDLPNTP